MERMVGVGEQGEEEDSTKAPDCSLKCSNYNLCSCKSSHRKSMGAHIVRHLKRLAAWLSLASIDFT